MKKKIILFASIFALIVLAFAISVGAQEWTYKDESGNTYLTLTMDENKVITDYDGSFPMWDENGEPLTWYVIATDTEKNVKTVKSFISYDPVYSNIGNGVYRFIKAADFTLSDTYPVPTRENVVSLNMPNDMGITAFSNYSAYNFHAGLNYTPDAMEILFLRCPNTLTITDRMAQGSKVLEVEFDKDSVFTTLSHVSFYEARSLRKVNIPASVEVIASQSDNNGRAFYNCISLSEIIFDEGSNLTSIQNGAFKGCSSLKEIALPPSLTVIENNTLSYVSGFEVIRLPENFTHFINTNSNGSIRNDHHSFTYGSNNIKEYYLPESFYAVAPETKYRVSYAFYGGTGSSVKFFYCGTLEQLENAMYNFRNYTSSSTDNNSNFTSAQYISYADYLLDTEAYSTGDYIIYGYNSCDAFHGGKHDMTAPTYGFTGEAFLSDYCEYSSCTRCGEDITNVISGALFVNKGYAKALDGSSFTYGIAINRDEIAKFEAFTGEKVNYGILAAKKEISENGLLVNGDGTAIEGVISADFTNNSYSIFNLKITDIAEEKRADKIYCGAYAVIGTEVKYFGDSVDDKAYLVSSESILNIEE